MLLTIEHTNRPLKLIIPLLLQVRKEDQDQINEFGKLNNRLLEIRAELKQAKLDVEKLDDATTELTMASGSGKIMVLIGLKLLGTCVRNQV